MNGDIRDIVVVGAGLGGAKTVEALRGRGFDGRLVLIGEEPERPYERPPLSKGYLTGADAFEKAYVLPERWFADHDVDLRLGTAAVGVDPGEQVVTLSDGSTARWDRLVLATGSAPRRLDVPNADAAGVLYLRTRRDADAIRAEFGAGRRLVVVGGGWIGLEVAAAARQAGTEVTVLEAAELPLLGVLGPELARVFADLHRDHGVDLRCGAAIAEITVDPAGRADGVRLSDGSVLDATAVVIGVGVLPRVELAHQAGLDTGNGVLVDAALQTSDPRVAAVGDIANHAHPLLHARVRVEHWAAALNQPAAAAATLLGSSTPYRALPYFFSDQYDLGMEYLGHAPRGSYSEVVVRGDLDAREFVAFWLDDQQRLRAAMNVNVWDVPDAIRPLIEDGSPVDREALRDPAVPLAELAARSGRYPGS